MGVKKCISEKYCQRFGRLAVELGFITVDDLKAALAEQVDDEMEGRQHRLLGRILFDNDRMSSEQIDCVVSQVLKAMRDIEGQPA